MTAQLSALSDSAPSDEQLGRCDHCGGGVWSDMEHVQVGSRYWHRGCAEALVADLEAVL